MFEISRNARRLSKDEKNQYEKLGYVKNLPVFSHEGVKSLHLLFLEPYSQLY